MIAGARIRTSSSFESRSSSFPALGFLRSRFFAFAAMPSPRAFRNAVSSSSKVVADKSGRSGGSQSGKLRRPRTVPDLISWERNASASPVVSSAPGEKPKLVKVLINVTVQGSVGAVQVLMNPESIVKDLISVTLKQYLKEGRRPMISGSSVEVFDLHFSQFCLESLNREEKLSALGSRNFFLCKRNTVAAGDGGGPVTTCSKQAERATMRGLSWPWLKFMSFLF